MRNKKLLMILAVILLLCVCFSATACKVEEYKVTFIMMNAEVENEIQDQIVKSNKKKVVKPPDPVNRNTDFEFGGWYKDVNCTQEFDFDRDRITSDTELYAKWNLRPGAAVKFTVTYDFQQGTGDKLTYEATFGEPFEFIVPTRDGFEFIGWYGLPNAKGMKYTSVDGKGLVNWPGTSNTTVYAFWYDASGEPYGYSSGKRKAPDFTVYKLDGTTAVKLSDFYGKKAVFLSIWETW